MPIRFIARVTRTDAKRLGFHTPTLVTNFYMLKPGKYKGGISLKHGEVKSCTITLKKYRKTLRGTFPEYVGEDGAIGEVWIYRDTWIEPKKK